MKNYLKKSEVNVSGDPEKLAYIGWESAASPQPVEVPGQPCNLYSSIQGAGIVLLKWDRPGSGGTVRNYIIEKRQQPAGGGEFSSWEIVATALNNEINLTGQPCGIQLEYRAKAVNTSGESPPSNTVMVVL